MGFFNGTGPRLAPGMMGARAPQAAPQAAPRISTGRVIAGRIGDALSQLGGFEPIFAPQLQQLQQQSLRQQELQRQQAQPIRQEIGGNLVEYNPMTGQSRTLVRGEPRPPQPTALQQNYEYLQRTNPSLAPTYLRNQVDPVQFVTADNGDGTRTVVPVPRSGGQDRPAIGTRVQSLPGAPPAAAQLDTIGHNAATAHTITRAEASQVRAALGPNGQAAFEQWMQQNNVRIVE